MKYTVLGIQHKVGSYTPTSGKNAGIEKTFDFYRLHCVKRNRENIGQTEVVQIRVEPDLMGQLIAECGGKPENVLNRKLDFETRETFQTVYLKDFEVVE